MRRPENRLPHSKRRCPPTISGRAYRIHWAHPPKNRRRIRLRTGTARHFSKTSACRNRRAGHTAIRRCTDIRCCPDDWCKCLFPQRCHVRTALHLSSSRCIRPHGFQSAPENFPHNKRRRYSCAASRCRSGFGVRPLPQCKSLSPDRNSQCALSP